MFFKKEVLTHFTDPDLGDVFIKYHPTAKQYICRFKNNGIVMTSPVGSSKKSIIDAFNSMKPRLIVSASKKQQEKSIDFKNADFEISGVRVRISESNYGNMTTVTYKNNILEIICQAGIDYDSPQFKAFFDKAITKVMKLRADNYLPGRLDEIACKIGVKYRKCSVSYGKQRLGRCDSQGEILLSYRLMFLPGHLRDYVIKHELTHLTEMNHGEGFHRLLDKYCNGEHRKLDKELKQFKYPV